MLIVCPSCSSRYNLAEDKLAPQGSLVRCASCHHQWQVMPPPVGDAALMLSDPPDAAAIQQMLHEAYAAASAEASANEHEGALADPAAPQSDGADIDAGDAHAHGADRSDMDETMSAQAGSDQIDGSSADPSRPRRKGPRIMGANAVRNGGAGQRKGSGFSRIWHSAGPYLAASLAMAALVALGVLRDVVAHRLPATIPVYAALGLPVSASRITLAQVTSNLLRDGDKRLLMVEGQLANTHRGVQRVPRLEIVVRDAQTLPLYAWTITPEGQQMQPGATLPFRARLAAPPEGAASVEVRFDRSLP